MTSRFMHFCDIRKNIPVLSRELFPSINKIFGTTYSIVFALLRHGYHVLLVIFSRVFGLLHDNEVSLRAIHPLLWQSKPVDLYQISHCNNHSHQTWVMYALLLLPRRIFLMKPDHHDFILNLNVLRQGSYILLIHLFERWYMINSLRDQNYDL